MAKLRSTDLNGNLFVSGQLKLQRPFLISTDELITNLNADQLDGKDADDLAITTHLGYYDTMTENSDGSYTITRQTGYYNISNDLIEHGYYRTTQGGHGEYGGDVGIHNLPIVSEQKSFINNLLAVRDTGEVYSGLIGIAITRDGGCWMNLGDNYNSKEKYVAYLSQNNIYIQYKLVTATTEKVEANHYARYNQRFILEHNKSEAERSANLLPPSCFYPNNNIQSDGSLGTYDGYSCYYKVPVKPNTTYVASRTAGIISNNLGIAMYDINGSFLKYVTWSGSKGTTENNVYFISFDFYNSYTNIMLNEGSTPLPYQPYEGKVVHEKGLGTFVTTDTPQTISSSKTFSGNQIFTGYLDIRGTAAEKHLKTRGIGGSDGNGNEAELYLQYNSSYATKFGRSGDGSLNSDGTITEAGKLLSDKYAAKSHTHTKSQVGLGNVDNTADANKSVKYATSAGTANSVPEANLTWGGKNFAGGYGPIDAAMVPSLGANRLAFVPAAGVTVEYSRDGGSTWTDYGLNDTQKTAMFSGPQTSTGAVIGKPSRNSSTKKYENVSVNNRLRVTLKSDTAHVYTALNKFVIYCSTNGSTGCKCTIQGLTKNNYDAGNNSWTTFADGVDISGWSGFNVINTSSIITYSNNGSQYIQIRFTFYCGGNSSMETYGGLSIINIYGFGGVGWTTPSNMAKWGQLYSYDAGQNVFFPANVAAKTISVDTINGATLGNAIMRQNTSTGDVILGSTVRQLRLWGNGDRPTYSKDDGASYKNLALLSDLNGYLPLSGGTLTGKLYINASLNAPGSSDPSLAINYSTSAQTITDANLNMIKFGSLDNYIGEAPASRTIEGIPAFAFHTTMGDNSEFAWLSAGWDHRMSLGKGGLTLHKGKLTLSDDIVYKGAKSSGSVIKFMNNTADEWGNGIKIGGGGATIIGGGESASRANVSGGDEVLYLMNDAGIDFYSNCQDGLSSAKHMTFDTAGTLNVPTDVVGSSSSNKLIFRHLDGQNCNGNYDLYLQYHQRNTKIYLNGTDYYIENGSYYNGTAAYANSAGNADTVDGKHSSDFYLSGSNITNLPINGGIYWNSYVESSSDGSDAASITVIKDGNGTSGTVLQIKQANDANDIVNVVAGDLKVNGNSVINSGNIGSQSVNYATSAHLLRTYNAGNGSHGEDYYLKCRHNVDNNDRFKLQIVRADGSVTHSTSVDYANSAGSAGSANALNSLGRISCLSGASRYDSGLRMHQVYSNGYPFSYGSSITIENGFGAEIIFNGLGGGGNTGSGEMQFRTHSDWDTSEWGSWRTVIDSSNIGSQNVNYANSAGSAGSVAWSNVSDKPNILPYTPLNGGLLTTTTTSSWGVQTGSETASFYDDAGGGLKFRKNCPSNGKMSMIIDGTVYVNEGKDRVIDTSNLSMSFSNGVLTITYK